MKKGNSDAIAVANVAWLATGNYVSCSPIIDINMACSCDQCSILYDVWKNIDIKKMKRQQMKWSPIAMYILTNKQSY